MKHARTYERLGARIPEACFSAGPQQLGEVGDGSLEVLFGAQWILVWEQSGLLKLAQGATETGISFTLPDTARHVALAFDQVAKPVVAWEASGQIYVWEMSTEITHGPFPGHDPLLINDAPLGRSVAGSDVCLFYLGQNRMTLQCRLQRDAYLLAEDFYTYPGEAWLDRVVMHPFELEIRSNQDALFSAFYPIQSTEMLAASGAVSSGVVLNQDIETTGSEPISGSGVVSSGLIEDLYLRVSTEAVSGSGAITGGNLDLAFTRTNSEGVSGTGSIPSVLLENVGIERSSTENITGYGLVSSVLLDAVGIERSVTEVVSGSGAITGGILA